MLLIVAVVAVIDAVVDVDVDVDVDVVVIVVLLPLFSPLYPFITIITIPKCDSSFLIFQGYKSYPCQGACCQIHTWR